MFGTAIIIDGEVWSYEVEKDDKGNNELMTFKEAREHCRKKGRGKGFECDLPNIKRYENIASYMGNWRERWFWTSTAWYGSRQSVIYCFFNGENGSTPCATYGNVPYIVDDVENELASVRCYCSGK